VNLGFTAKDVKRALDDVSTRHANDPEPLATEHTHDFDEWVFVLEGRCMAVVGDVRTELRAGDELLVCKGTKQRMEVAAGTRTVHVFGGRRAERG
jgi:mannose-6-phosphate isomerase-like protein (cupin superfamily)